MNFKDFEIDSEVIKNIGKKGIKTPTEIQKEVIPKIFQKRDLIVHGKTGSGKTLSYLLPLITRIESNPKERVLIIVPTRELVVQISEVVTTILEGYREKMELIYGGRELSENTKKIGEKKNFIIAVPGRLKEYIAKKIIDLSKISVLIIDEADLMIEMGFKNDMEEIVKKLSEKRETLMFSATFSSDIKKIAYRYTKNPELISINEEGNKFSHINQRYVETTDRRKVDILSEMINEDNPFLGIIFCRTKARVDKLDMQLLERGFKCQKLHSDIPQPKREKIMKSFKNMEVQFLIATDIASRGIDVLGVTHIYNYDCPENIQDYVHRIGRTGRGKEKGESILIITEKDSEILKEIKNYTKTTPTKREVEYKVDTQCRLDIQTGKYDKKINISSKKLEEIKIIKQRARIKKEFTKG